MANDYSISVEVQTVRDLMAVHHAFEAFEYLLAKVPGRKIDRSEVLALLSVLNGCLCDVSTTLQIDLDSHDTLVEMGYVFPSSAPLRPDGFASSPNTADAVV
jgi:hypothetical protein